MLPFEVILGGGTALDSAVTVALNPVSGSAMAAVCGACSVASAGGGAGSMRTGGSGAVIVTAM
jgi:hypothetical protein